MPKPENEPPAQRTPLTLEEVTRMASEVVRKHHHHQPTLIAEGSTQAIITQITPLGQTHEQRASQLFITGLKLAQDGVIGVLAQAFFISEAWMSVSPDANWPDVPPSQDPQRREVLLIAQVNVQTHQKDATVLEMVRNAEEQVIELKALYSGIKALQQVESPLLNAFVQGFIQGMSGKIKLN